MMGRHGQCLNRTHVGTKSVPEIIPFTPLEGGRQASEKVDKPKVGREGWACSVIQGLHMVCGRDSSTGFCAGNAVCTC
jgi:hypothetical protein